MQDDASRDLLAGLSERDRYASWRLVRPGHSPIGFGSGGRELLLVVRRTSWLGRFLCIVPEPVLDGAYRLVAANRSRLGRLVPDRPGPRSFP